MSALPEHVRASLFTDLAGVCRDYAAGATRAEMIARYGISWDQINAIRKRAGVPPRAGGRFPRKIPVDAEKEVTGLYGEGWTKIAIARKFGCSCDSSVHTILQRAGELTTKERTE